MSLRHTTYNSFSVRDIESGSLCVISGISKSERGCIETWEQYSRRNPSKVIRVIGETSNTFSVEDANGKKTIYLRDQNKISDLFGNSSKLYIDISGLPHHVWAPMMKVALRVCSKVLVTYTEPNKYDRHSNPSSPSLFDLTNRFQDIAPVPGFASILGPDDESQTIFVPLLGFEGQRARQLLVSLDPPPSVIIPVVGVPGYRMEYPQYTITCNREFLRENRAFVHIRTARADEPFDTRSVLQGIQRDYSGYYMYIAPVGTKPQSLAAFTFALDHGVSSEIMYDHPVRRGGSRIGVGDTHVYELSLTNKAQ